MEGNRLVYKLVARAMDIKCFKAGHLFVVSPTPSLWVGGASPMDGSSYWYWDQVVLVTPIVDAVVWSES